MQEQQETTVYNAHKVRSIHLSALIFHKGSNFIEPHPFNQSFGNPNQFSPILEEHQTAEETRIFTIQYEDETSQNWPWLTGGEMYSFSVLSFSL